MSQGLSAQHLRVGDSYHGACLPNSASCLHLSPLLGHEDPSLGRADHVGQPCYQALKFLVQPHWSRFRAHSFQLRPCGRVLISPYPIREPEYCPSCAEHFARGIGQRLLELSSFAQVLHALMLEYFQRLPHLLVRPAGLSASKLLCDVFDRTIRLCLILSFCSLIRDIRSESSSSLNLS